VVSDQHGIPTSAEDLVEVTRTILMAQLDHPDAKKWGIYHYAGEGVTTWYDYAQYILDTAYTKGNKPGIKSIATEEHRRLNKAVTNRPLYTALDTHHIQDMFGVKVRPWKEGVKTVVGKLL
jgi:dTDP-4-dehydrorhamnose reductase